MRITIKAWLVVPNYSKSGEGCWFTTEPPTAVIGIEGNRIFGVTLDIPELYPPANVSEVTEVKS